MNCNRGVFANQNVNCDIRWNDFNQNSIAAVQLNGCTNRSLNVNNNRIRNFFQGIVASNYGNATLTIDNNLCISNYFFPTGTFYANAIHLTNKTTSSTVATVNITGNTISATRIGIYASTLNRNMNISGNQISMNI